MGCVVNGPGEAADADLGVAGGGETAACFLSVERKGFYPESERWSIFWQKPAV